MFRSGGFPRTGVLALTLALLLLVLTAGCSSDGDRGDAGATVGRADFAGAMEDRYGIDEVQAGCIADYVYEDYDAAEIGVLADEGMAALPQARWEPYLNATVACITHDEPLEGAP